MKYFEDLKNSPLFEDLNEMSCMAMMHCLKTKVKIYLKNQVVAQQGDMLDYILLIVRGKGKVSTVDEQGEICVNDMLVDGDIFGLDNLYDYNSPLRSTLIAAEKMVVMEIDKHRLLNPCPNKCYRHEMVLKGTIRLLAKQNSNLNNQFSFINKKTIRGKLMAYFTYLVAKNNSNYFELPFNKTDLAHYLGVDRSAMSTELNKMKKSGLIDYDKREFHLIKKHDSIKKS